MIFGPLLYKQSDWEYRDYKDGPPIRTLRIDNYHVIVQVAKSAFPGSEAIAVTESGWHEPQIIKYHL